MDTKDIPLFWINLNRAKKRRARMDWAIKQGGWKAHRFDAIDSNDMHQRLLALPNPFRAGTPLPGLYLLEEAKPKQPTKRSELACLASWKRLLITAKKIKAPRGWVLLMEDDLGASLAASHDWAHTLIDLIEFCPDQTLAIQLAPISAAVRQQLATEWQQSNGTCLAISKENVRSHGNGAVLLHQKALDLLIDPLLCLTYSFKKNWHPLLHPWKIRPVADKWLYGALPAGSCQVATYPHFCLEAEDSTLHLEHVAAFHKPSRDVTMRIWKRDQRESLLKAQYTWDQI